MPKRRDISKVMLIGAGPIVIGQACEFDYSGAQACKALREEGMEVVLVNSNPATIMTDPGFADRTYIEPLTVEVLTAILRRERPDALLATMGGQTALNLAVELEGCGVLRRYGVELIGACGEVIRRAEDRGAFRETMVRVGLETPRGGAAHSLEEALEIQRGIGAWPVMVRPAFTLGGTGGGVAHGAEELARICADGFGCSPAHEVLVEESVLGWKEVEMEVMRDGAGGGLVICSIENLDPMGVHTGDSLAVAPAMTLGGGELAKMGEASLGVMAAVGVGGGGANVQFAVNPADGRQVVIEMNPRVSRSSALASKATGFPIAKVATKVAIGYTLEELGVEGWGLGGGGKGHVVVKAPRFAFEKFAGSDDTLTTQMKSVGETMALGGTFQEAFQKALRSLEVGRHGFSPLAAVGGGGGEEGLGEGALAAEVARPSPRRIFAIREALKRGWGVERVGGLCQMDPWFLRKMEELTLFEGELRGAGGLAVLRGDRGLFLRAKALGFSDWQIGELTGAGEGEVRGAREVLGLHPGYGVVGGGGGGGGAAYYFSTYGAGGGGAVGGGGGKGKGKVMILGGGPNRIGQGIEFDYCCVHASQALRAAGFETVMVNSNPETVSTDYDMSDRLYFEPVTLEDVLEVYRWEGCRGVIVQFGGQTPLNLALALEGAGVRVMGTSPADIEKAEDREFFSRLAAGVGVKQPRHGTALGVEEAFGVARRIGFPVLVRPSYVLGGRGMAIIYTEEFFKKFCKEAFQASGGRSVLIEEFLEDAIEVDVDCLADGEREVIGAVMEHIEKAGIHSGDSACMIPPYGLSAEMEGRICRATRALARALGVRGLMNVQYAVQGGEVYIIEANPRASRTVPFAGKATGVALAGLAARVMAGERLSDLGIFGEVRPAHVAVKEAVLPFARFPGCDVALTPEMHSTGEVMGIDLDVGMAFIKSQIAAGNPLPGSGGVFMSISGERKADREEMIGCARELVEMGYSLHATCGTATALREAGIRAAAAFGISEGRPNVMDLMGEGSVGWIINVPSGCAPQLDEVRMRAEASRRGVPLTTTIRGLRAAIGGLRTLRERKEWEVMTLQEYHRRTALRARGAG